MVVRLTILVAVSVAVTSLIVRSSSDAPADTTPFRMVVPLVARDSASGPAVTPTPGLPPLPECFTSRGVSYSCYITTVAGSGPPDVGDSGPATAAMLQGPTGIVVGPDGWVYFTDRNNHRVRRFVPGGVIETVAGTGSAENRDIGDGGRAIEAQLRFPDDLAFGPDGLLYVADTRNYRVRRIDSKGIITTVAGNGTALNNPASAGMAALDAAISGAHSIAFDTQGRLYISEFDRNRVWRVSREGLLEHIAGNGAFEESGDGGPATAAGVRALSIAVAGNRLYIAGRTLRVVDLSTGRIQSVPGFEGATANNVDIGGDGRILVSANSRVVAFDPVTGAVTPVAGTSQYGFGGDGGPAAGAVLSTPRGVTLDSRGTIYVSDSENNLIRAVSPDGLIGTAVGGKPAVNPSETAQSTVIYDSQGIVVDKAGNVLYIDFDHHLIRRLTPAGIVTTVAGTEGGGHSGDGGHPLSARFNAPTGLVLDHQGNLLFIDETAPSCVRIIHPGADGLVDGSSDETIQTIAGRIVGSQGEFPDSGSADGGSATRAVFQAVRGLAVDSRSNLYVADWQDNRIRKIVPGRDGVLNGGDDEIITTIAGDGIPGSNGDGGPSVNSRIDRPGGASLAIDPADNLYIRDGNGRVRRIDAASSIITTYAEPAEVGNIFGFVVTAGGDIYGAFNTRVYRWDHSTRRTTLVAGTGETGFAGDDGDARAARLTGARNIAVDASGNLYLVDNGNFRIRIIRISVR